MTRARPAWRRATWLAVVVALGLALAAGSGAFGGQGPAKLSLYQRALQLAGQYRCPVCQGESAAVSDAPAAVQIRDQIETWLRQGRSPAQVRTYMVADYGTAILEKPPASGASLLVWLLPGAAAAAGLAGLGLAFARWRRAGVGGRTDGVLPQVVPPPGPLERAVPPPGRLAQALPGTPLDGEAKPAPVPAPAPRRRQTLTQRATLAGGLGLVALAGALWLVDRTSSSQAASPPATTAPVSLSSELQEAAGLARQHPVDALVIYQAVLRADPGQPVALAAEGWIYAQGGYVAQGLALLAKAEASDPSYPPPHLYRGLVLLDDAHRPAAAVSELRWYLAHGPAKSEVDVARAALSEARAQSRVAPRG